MKYESRTYTQVVPVASRVANGNLPAESTSFVGRRRLLTEVEAAFANTRLLTLVGPGGVGKTRLVESWHLLREDGVPPIPSRSRRSAGIGRSAIEFS